MFLRTHLIETTLISDYNLLNYSISYCTEFVQLFTVKTEAWTLLVCDASVLAFHHIPMSAGYLVD